ncbi:MAG TPA: hypothetical protein DHW82_04460 [Spirochaetia bacterium]|nr:MAG: hypothetical protein A2Y41_10750 [Spirochaetes bacterium GWB1_36_13]HCL56246.1 hypothetical protein [Spirochaetia bacterium]
MQFETLYIQKKALDYPLTKKYREYFQKNGFSIQIIEDENKIPRNLNQKKNLFLTEKKGGFVKPCPCTPQAVCCGYHNVNLVEGCPFICNYCALDVYLDFPATKVFVNLSDFERELDEYEKNHPFLRLGTGELSDSLVWDPIFPYSEYLLDVFSRYPHIIFEYKTKSANVKHFPFNSGKYRNILISFSVNTLRKISEEETLVSGLNERIESAKSVRDKGYKVGFHFDPIYYYDGFEKDYEETVEQIFSQFAPQDIGWVSLGVIRFAPDLKEALYQRNTKILDMEMFPAHFDGKMRVFYPIRKKIFQFLIQKLTPFTDKIYLCMEPFHMWEELGLNPASLNQRIYESFFKG